MKKIYETISDMILPATIFIAAIAIIAGAALFTKAGQRMDVEGEDFSNSMDAGEMQEICEREAPTITYTGKKVWNTGETIITDSVFQAEDVDGNPVEVEVRDITDQKGDSAMDCFREADRSAAFPNRGVYTFRLTAMDGERKSTTKRISLVVDPR